MIAKQVVSAGSWRLLAAFAVACSLCAVTAERASAWPGNDQDLCAAAQHPSEVSTVDPIRSRDNRGQEGVWTIRACTPVLRLGGLATASPTEMFKHVLPDHVLQGGANGPSLARGRLNPFPFLLGPEGQAVRYQALLGSEILRNALVGAGVSFTSAIVVAFAVCKLGIVVTAGVSCAAAAFAGIPAAAVAGIVGAISGVIGGLIKNQLERVTTMASSAWDFSVPSGWKGWIVWNGFGTIAHNYIDPSFSNTWPHETPPFHIWAWFSTYPFAQGPNPDLGRRGGTRAASAAGPIGPANLNPANLRTFRGEITRNGPDHIVEISAAGRRIHPKQGENVLVATGAHDDLIGNRNNDVLAALGPFDRLYGGAGDDELVGVGRGDRLYGGTGFDELVAAGPGEWLYGIQGNDTLISEHGGAMVMAGRIARVDVRNGRATDTVICPRVNRDIVIADPGDRVSRSCKYVFVNGRGTPASPAMVGRRGFNGSHQGTRPIGP
jgi:hypothetical protein